MYVKWEFLLFWLFYFIRKIYIQNDIKWSNVTGSLPRKIILLKLIIRNDIIGKIIKTIKRAADKMCNNKFDTLCSFDGKPVSWRWGVWKIEIDEAICGNLNDLISIWTDFRVQSELYLKILKKFRDFWEPR